MDEEGRTDAEDRSERVRTHCYHCSELLPARAVELLDKLMAEGDLPEAEMAELNSLDCSNGCFS